MPLLNFACALGTPFEVRRFRVRESVNELFAIDLVTTAADPNVDLEAIVGQAATFEMVTGYAHASSGRRSWAGVCNHVKLAHGVDSSSGARSLSTYEIRIVPALWLLSQRTNHRIWQRMSIPDIVDALLAEWNVPVTWKVNRGAYPKLEFKVQYGETDYQLLCRLLEEAGISFVFASADENGAVVFSDELNVQPLREVAPLPYEDNPLEAAQRDFVTKVVASFEVRPGAHQIVDYNFRNPSFRLYGEGGKAAPPEDAYERYEYRPGSFVVEGKKDGTTPAADDKGAYRSEGSYGTARAQRALEADRTGRRALAFETNVIDLAPGVGLRIDHHPTESIGQPLLVTAFEVHGTPAEKWHMSARAVYRADPFRPALRTPKPRVHGVQSATVVGPKGQEIHTDEFGRVRVQFPWDREGKSDDESTCWMRVSQGWSGTGFGMINIPRIGQEVLVGFLDGDPDQPMVVGRVFNALQPVPYKLPENKTVSGWKTASSPATGGYNEIKLEDKADKELIYVRAQKDRHELVRRDETKRIERRHRRTILADQDLVVKKVKRELVEVDDHLHVKGHRFQKIDQSTSLTVGVDRDEKVGNKHALEAGKEIHLKAGSVVVVEAGSRLTVKGPGGFIDIHAGGIDIVGNLVKINSGGSAGSGSGAKPTEPKDAEEAFPKDSSDQIED